MSSFRLPYQPPIYYISALCIPPRLVIIDAGVELALVVVPRADLPAPESPALIEPVDSVESTQHGLEVNVDRAVVVALVQLYVLNRAELDVVSKQD
jgi:hypothetical protein